MALVPAISPNIDHLVPSSAFFRMSVVSSLGENRFKNAESSGGKALESEFILD